MTEERQKYHAGPTDRAEPPLTTEALIAAAHAHHQGIPYETGEHLGGKMTASDVAYAVVAPIDRIEKALAAMDQNRHGFTPPPAALPRGPPETARPQTLGSGKP